MKIKTVTTRVLQLSKGEAEELIGLLNTGLREGTNSVTMHMMQTGPRETLTVEINDGYAYLNSLSKPVRVSDR